MDRLKVYEAVTLLPRGHFGVMSSHASVFSNGTQMPPTYPEMESVKLVMSVLYVLYKGLMINDYSYNKLVLVVNFTVILTVFPLGKLQDCASAAQSLTSTESTLQSPFDPANSKQALLYSFHTHA